MEEIVDNRDIEILGVLEDYKKYCFEENLIPERHKWMRAIVTGTTLTDNIKYSLYYDDATRGYSDHGYIGLYSNKSIRAIGKLIKICEVSSKSGSVDDLCFDIKKGEKLTNEETENIKAAIIHAKEFDYDLPQVPHNFFIVDKFYPVDFYKKSKYPIQKSKYFNLAQMLKVKELGPTETIVKELNGKAWEEFE